MGLHSDRHLTRGSTTLSDGNLSVQTNVAAATYADLRLVTPGFTYESSLALEPGTWLIFADVMAQAVNLAFLMHIALTDYANNLIAEGSTYVPASGTAGVYAWAHVGLRAIVTPTFTTTYKLQAARGLTTLTNTWVAADGSGANIVNNNTTNSNLGTGLRAVRLF